MADNPYTVKVPNVLEALMQGEQGYKEISDYRKSNEQDAARKQASELWQSGNTQGALAALLAANDPKNITALGHYQQNANGVYGTPIMLQQPDGSYKVGAIGKGGQGAIIDFGQGNSPTVPAKSVDTGTGTYIIPGRVAGAGGASVQAQPGGPPQGQPQGQPGGQQPAIPAQGYYPKDLKGAEADKRLGHDTGEKLATMGKAQSSIETVGNSLDRLAETANKIKNDPALGRITGIVGKFPNWPGGHAADAQAQLETLKSQAAFTVLQSIRDASKTGGAVGQVSNFEEQMLMNNLAAVDRMQSEGKFKEAMDLIINYTKAAKERMQRGYETDYGGLQRPQQAGQPGPQPSQNSLPKGVNSKVLNGKTYFQIGNKWYEQ